MDRQTAKDRITSHEGRRSRAYADSEGIMTIGIGMNLKEDRNKKRIEAAGLDYEELCTGTVPLEDRWIDQWFDQDLDIALTDALATVADFWSHPENLQQALVDMSFQLGGPRLRKFVNMIGALDSKPPEYMRAADEIADSAYARQTPNRAADNIALVRGCAT